jgi:hypothetical protein
MRGYYCGEQITVYISSLSEFLFFTCVEKVDRHHIEIGLSLLSAYLTGILKIGFDIIISGLTLYRVCKKKEGMITLDSL